MHSAPHRTVSPHSGPVTACYDPLGQTIQTLENLRAAGLTFRDLADRYGFTDDGALIHRVMRGHVAWSTSVIQAVTGQPWQTARVIFCDEVHVPKGVQVHSPPPVECPVTGVWFIPTHGQKYAPGLSAAVKRAARRDLAKARKRYQREGDWGLQ